MYSGITYGLKEARGAHDWVRKAISTFIIFLPDIFFKTVNIVVSNLIWFIHEEWWVSSYQEQLCSTEQLCFCSRKIVLLLGQSQEQLWLLQWKILHTSRLFNVPSRGPHFLPQPIFSQEYSRILVMEKKSLFRSRISILLGLGLIETLNVGNMKSHV